MKTFEDLGLQDTKAYFALELLTAFDVSVSDLKKLFHCC